MNNNYSPQLNTAINAAIQAGKIIMRFYSRLENLKVMTKGHNDYVSEADQQAESIIKDTLMKAYPSYKITAEENLTELSEIEERIVDLLEEYVKPAVQQDGGNISFVSYENKVVKVQLEGACSGCPSSTLTLQSGIKSILQRMLPTLIEDVVPV